VSVIALGTKVWMIVVDAATMTQFLHFVATYGGDAGNSLLLKFKNL